MTSPFHFQNVRGCCQSKPKDLVVMEKKDKTCKVSVAALRAFNVYTINKQQNFDYNTIDFNDALVQKNIAKDAVK